MRITKFGHACVRVEHDGATVVIDPGVFTDAEARRRRGRRADHPRAPDHYLPDHLRATDAPVWTIEAVARQIRERRPGRRRAGHRGHARGGVRRRGLPVRAVGELHAVIHPELPRFDNSGYVLTARRDPRLPPGRRADRSPAARRRAVRPGVRAVDEGVRRDRLRPRGPGAAQPGDPRPGLLRGRAGDRRRPHEPLPARRGLEYVRLADGKDLT